MINQNWIAVWVAPNTKLHSVFSITSNSIAAGLSADSIKVEKM